MFLTNSKLIFIFLYQILFNDTVALRSSHPSSLSVTPSSSLSLSSSSSLPISPPQSTSGVQIITAYTNCTRDFFEVQVDLSKKFHGIFFAKDFPDECRIGGNLQTHITLRLPTFGCGIRSELKSNGSLEFSVRVMLQMDEKLRQSSDIIKTIRCYLLPNMMSMDLIKSVEIGKSYRNGKMQSENKKITLPKVRVWLELNGPSGTGIVDVGQATTLSIRAIVPGTIGVRVIDCLALDGRSELSQQLLDNRGCPFDEQVMPALHTHYRLLEEGWSKPQENDLMERLLTATFPAFKFPDRERLHVNCGVQLCKGKCPDINCRSGDQFVLPSEKQLGRVEVFNSLAVTAPQIETNRLGMDERNNVSVEEYPPKIYNLHSESTLCLSISKLAMVFCTLGVIFLIAVIIAVCCLIRSKNLVNNSVRTSSTSIFSSTSSGAQSQFSRKLLIPYSGRDTLPYGRVY